MPRLKIKTVFPRYRDSHVKGKTVVFTISIWHYIRHSWYMPTKLYKCPVSYKCQAISNHHADSTMTMLSQESYCIVLLILNKTMFNRGQEVSNPLAPSLSNIPWSTVSDTNCLNMTMSFTTANEITHVVLQDWTFCLQVWPKIPCFCEDSGWRFFFL